MADLNKFYVAQYECNKNWKFLCRYEESKTCPIIIGDFKPNRSEFINVRLVNDSYVIREATEEEVNEVMVNMI